MNKYTEYAHEYLSGSNLVPIGVLDSPEFQAECRRLWGPVVARPAGALKRIAVQVKALEKYLAARRGPRGGLPKTNLAEYRRNEALLIQLKKELV